MELRDIYMSRTNYFQKKDREVTLIIMRHTVMIINRKTHEVHKTLPTALFQLIHKMEVMTAKAQNELNANSKRHTLDCFKNSVLV